MAAPARPKMVDGLDVNELDDGMIIFRESTDSVHHLNHTAAFVLQLCDGSRTATDIAALLAEAWSLPEPPLVETEDCLRSLAQQELIG
jgi:hypothetical protein